jgi:hypothetical protein
MLAHPGLTILLALLDGKAVATITVIVVPNLTRGCAPYALLENVVTPLLLSRQGCWAAITGGGNRPLLEVELFQDYADVRVRQPESPSLLRKSWFQDDQDRF